MVLNMPFSRYLAALHSAMNSSASLDILLAPFHLPTRAAPSPILLVGHIIDELASRFEAHASIDALDVATAAWDLGYDEAGAFLDSGPYVIYQMAKDGLAGLGR